MSKFEYEPKNNGHSFIKEQKLWKSGNSVVITVPKEVLNHFNVTTGDALMFDVNEDRVELVKKAYDDLDILKLVDRTLDRHGEIIEGLIER
ncbi:AbrB/MazE/SpoVT family DNA-binding domain-containing protein [Macrococcus capreoli]|uniref:AbrB/MazE/SpoVT family DNA-binding domain-containing protein n=1 Tax=Macrococcus capreoli TaxID=2982690 RepID=UPI0021D59993|nr:AbrB/MazE/SpoVT family DNA-binding domain-containing protein [Macrococcus sp. TMW 2.2395]MCU7557628.1 AbrB/MazE/SpoVT family DNA-binding domain-containing protein [Macrococcus sp. TMW 2.2395]